MRGWRVDSNVTPCLVLTGLPLCLSSVFPPSQVKVKSARTELGAAVRDSVADPLLVDF